MFIPDSLPRLLIFFKCADPSGYSRPPYIPDLSKFSRRIFKNHPTKHEPTSLIQSKNTRHPDYLHDILFKQLYV